MLGEAILVKLIANWVAKAVKIQCQICIFCTKHYLSIHNHDLTSLKMSETLAFLYCRGLTVDYVEDYLHIMSAVLGDRK